MQKKVIALAVAALASSAAMAQSNVTIYGLIDMSAQQYKSSGSGTNYKLNSLGGTNSSNGTGALNGSRIGFKGTEDLGNGLSALFNVEYGISLSGAEADSSANGAAIANASTGTGLGAMRTGIVGLTSATLGTVVAGTMYSPIDPTSGFAAGTQAHGGTNGGVGAASLLKTAQFARLTNAVAYITPTYSGFRAAVGYNFADSTRPNTGANNVANNYGYVAALDYQNGPIKAGYAYEKVNNTNLGTDFRPVNFVGGAAGVAATVANVGGVPTAVAAVAANNANDLNAGAAFNKSTDATYHVFGGQYDFGVVNVGFNQARAQAKADDGTADFKSVQNSISAKAPITAKASIAAAYTHGTMKLNGGKIATDSGYDLYAFYDLSKRTNVYALYSHSNVDTDNAASLLATNIKSTQYGLGLRHSF